MQIYLPPNLSKCSCNLRRNCVLKIESFISGFILYDIISSSVTAQINVIFPYFVITSSANVDLTSLPSFTLYKFLSRLGD
jgi:hypothetical protein